METKRLFIAAVLVWVIGSVAIYYLYSRGHLQEVSNVSVPSLRLAPLRGLVSITPTATDVARSLEADVVSRPGEANPAVTPVELPVSSSSVPTTAAPTTAAPTTAAPTPGRTKHGSEEQELRLGLAEKVDLPQDGSDIYISVLTTPGYHDSRLSRQYITWMQTVHPKQVRLAISNTTLQNCISLVLAHIGRHTHLFFTLNWGGQIKGELEGGVSVRSTILRSYTYMSNKYLLVFVIQGSCLGHSSGCRKSVVCNKQVFFGC